MSHLNSIDDTKSKSKNTIVARSVFVSHVNNNYIVGASYTYNYL